MSSLPTTLTRRPRGPRTPTNRIRTRLKKTFPLISMISSGYNFSDVLSDALAGLTVGLSVIPQSIAFAAIADLPPHYGLYASFMGPFVYILLGSVPEVTVGPTTLMALMIRRLADIHPGYAPFLTLCSGLIILACGILRLGFLVDFVSTPVISAYTSAASITIACNQLKNLFGISITKTSALPGHLNAPAIMFDPSHDSVLKTLAELLTNITKIRWQDTSMGIASIVLLVLLKEFSSLKCFESFSNEARRKCSKTTAWLIGISRNALVVILFSIVAYAVDGEDAEDPTFIVTGNIVGGLPDFDLPPFGINQTETIADPTLGQIIAECGSVLATLPMIMTIYQVAIAKAFSKSSSIDATQEMLAVGASNIVGSFFGSMPVTASFGRTAVNKASGVKTTLSGAVTGSIVLLALVVLMPFCAFIPKTTLAAVIICAVIDSIDYKIIIPIWKSKKIDLIPAFVTFVGCVFWSVEYGILVGIGIDLLFVLYHSARPNISSTILQGESSDENCSQLWITLDHGWAFPATAHIRDKIDAMTSQLRIDNQVLLNNADDDHAAVLGDDRVITNDATTIETEEKFATIVLDFSHVDFLDFTSANAIKDLVCHYEKIGHRVVIFRLRDSLTKILENANNKRMQCLFAHKKSDFNSNEQND